MPAPPKPDARPLWAITDKGKILPCPKGLPEGAILSCREGDAAWTRADPAQAPRPAARGHAAGPGLYDEVEVA